MFSKLMRKSLNLQGLVDVLHLAMYFGAPRLVALAEAALAALLHAQPSPEFGALVISIGNASYTPAAVC